MYVEDVGLLFAAALFVLFHLPMSLWACSCAGIFACDKPKHADVAFLGVALQSFHRPYVTRFAVKEVFTGNLDAREVLVSNGMGMCLARFTSGQAYVVFANWDASKKRLMTDMCAGNVHESALGAIAMLRELRSKGSARGLFGSVQGIASLASIPVTVQSASGVWRTQTGEDGTFRFPGFADGVYRVTAMPPSGETAEVRGRAFSRCEVLDIVVQGSSNVSGSLHGSTIPEGGSVVLLDPTSRRIIRERLYYATHSKGRFSFPSVLAGQYLLAVDLLTENAPNGWSTPPLRIYYPGTTDIARARKIKVTAGRNTVGLAVAIHPPPTRAGSISVTLNGVSHEASVSIEDLDSATEKSLPVFAGGRNIRLYSGRRYRLTAYDLKDSNVRHSAPLEIDGDGYSAIQLRIVHDGFPDRCLRCLHPRN